MVYTTFFIWTVFPPAPEAGRERGGTGAGAGDPLPVTSRM